MTEAGAIVRQLGFAMLVGGYGVWLLTFLWRLVETLATRKMSMGPFLIGFYGRAVGTVGLAVVMIGAWLADPQQWWILLVVFIFGAPALALLVWRPHRSAGEGTGRASFPGMRERHEETRPPVHSSRSGDGDGPNEAG